MLKISGNPAHAPRKARRVSPSSPANSRARRASVGLRLQAQALPPYPGDLSVRSYCITLDFQDNPDRGAQLNVVAS